MNRVKLWVFTLLVVAAGYLLVHAAASSRRADVLAGLDARLASAAAYVTASTTALGREASSVAVLVARDDGLVAALHAREAAPPPLPPPPPAAKGKKVPPAPALPARDPAAEEARARDAGRAALEKAEKSLGFDLPQGTAVTVGTREALARAGESSGGEGDATALLRAAAGGQARRGFVRHSGALWYAAARPVGDGAGVVVLVPLDDAWARRVATAAAVDVTLAVPEVKPLTTGRASDVPLLQLATKLAGAGDVGRPGEVDVSVGPMKVPRLPQPFAGGAPIRARAVPLEGVKGGYAVVSIPAAAEVNAPAVFHWRAVAGLALVLVVGLVLGLFVRSVEATPQVPDALLAVATRIEKGDFAARAPQLAGKLGTLASALNRAAEVAGPAAAALGAPAAPGTSEPRFQAPARPAEDRLPTAAALPVPGPTRTATVAAVAAPIPGPALEGDEETHWQQVFQDFLRTRASCGESTDGLGYEKFRKKLEANKAQLVAKYACKTVRFQVYVKEGKAALKATPVK